jgi:hypothetical protein
MTFRLLGLGMLALALPAWAHEAPLHPRALRVAAAPTLDGRLDDPAWLQAPVHDRFTQYLPVDRQPARWRTTVQVVVAADALVFGIRAWDPEPDRIRAPLARRDQVKADQDFVSVFIDPVGHRRTAQYVRISAAGAVEDGLYAAEEASEDAAPDFDVQAAVQRLPDGYSVELRWPLAALRYPHADGAPWRLMVARNIPREDRTLNLSAPLTKDALHFIAELQPLEGLDDLVEQVRERSFVAWRPELTLRSTRQTDEAGVRQRSHKASLGAEIKWRPRADWVIDATLNPDFSQVELDAPQLAGNTRFALSVPEKRPFFLESADVVGPTQADESGENRSLAAFYTRAITDPDWGLRATWRGAGAEATALHLRDAGGGPVLRAGAFATRMGTQPRGSEASFARARRQLGDVGVAGLMSRRDFGGGRTTQVVGSDAVWRAGDSDQWRGHLLLSGTTLGVDGKGEVQRVARERGHRAWLGWRHLDADWFANVNVEEISPRFANDNGFVSQSGIRRASAFGYLRLGPRELLVDMHESEIQLKVQETRTLADPLLDVAAGQVVDRLFQPGFWFAAARNTGVWGHVGLDSHRAKSGGRLHATRTLLLGFESNPGELLSFLMAEVEWGRRLDVDADRVGLGLQAEVEAKLRTPLPGGAWWLEFEQRLGLGWVDGPSGQRAFTDRSVRSLIVLHLNPRDSLRLIHQQLHFTRRADAATALTSEDSRQRQLALMFQHRIGLSRILSIGLNRASERPGRARQHELFAKLTLGY